MPERKSDFHNQGPSPADTRRRRKRTAIAAVAVIGVAAAAGMYLRANSENSSGQTPSADATPPNIPTPEETPVGLKTIMAKDIVTVCDATFVDSQVTSAGRRITNVILHPVVDPNHNPYLIQFSETSGKVTLMGATFEKEDTWLDDDGKKITAPQCSPEVYQGFGNAERSGLFPTTSTAALEADKNIGQQQMCGLGGFSIYQVVNSMEGAVAAAKVC